MTTDALPWGKYMVRSGIRQCAHGFTGLVWQRICVRCGLSGGQLSGYGDGNSSLNTYWCGMGAPAPVRDAEEVYCSAECRPGLYHVLELGAGLVLRTDTSWLRVRRRVRRSGCLHQPPLNKNGTWIGVYGQGMDYGEYEGANDDMCMGCLHHCRRITWPGGICCVC